MTSVKILAANALLFGTVIGAGIFGLPYSMSRAGLAAASVIFMVATAIVVLVHLLTAELSIESKSKHRVPGLISGALGKKWGDVSGTSLMLGGLGALLAYLILGAGFLKTILGGALGENMLSYLLIFLVFNALFVTLGLKTVEKVEILLSTLLVVAIGALTYFSFQSFSPLNIAPGDSASLLLPYGALMFALWGTPIVPQITEILDKKIYAVRASLVGSFGLIAFIYYAFALGVMGASSSGVSEDAISGLKESLGSDIVMLGAIFGFSAVASSFISIAHTIKDAVVLDFGFNKSVALPIVLIAPLALYFLGIQDFIKIIAISGAVFLGLEGILILFAHKRVSKSLKHRILPMLPDGIYYLLASILALGILSAVYYIFV